jgi:hypothetical protein
VSVNAGTSGPLVVFPLTIIKFFGGSINYATVRLFGLFFCLIPGVLLLYAAFINFFGDKIARIIILPLVVCIAFINHGFMIPYSGEHMPLLLTSLSVFLFSKIAAMPKKRLLYYPLLGFTLGCIPYTKLQAVPIALATASFCCLEIFFENKNNKKNLVKETVVFIIAISLPSIIVFTYVLSFNILFDFWQSYIISNISYTKNGLARGNWAEKILKMYRFIFTLPSTRLYFASLFLSSSVVAVPLLKIKQSISRLNRQLILLSSLILVAAACGIILPGSFFSHYRHLFIVPVAFFSGVLIGIFYTVYPYNQVWTRARLKNYYIVIFIIISVIIPAFFSILRGSIGIKFVNKYGIVVVESKVAKKIKEYARPNEKMTVWGWMDGYYIITGLLPGTKDPHSSFQINESKQQDYFLKRYASELIHNKPVIFLDAVAPQSFLFQDPGQRYENFPIVKEIVDKNYTLIEEIGGKRIYVRNDRYAEVEAERR